MSELFGLTSSPFSTLLPTYICEVDFGLDVVEGALEVCDEGARRDFCVGDRRAHHAALLRERERAVLEACKRGVGGRNNGGKKARASVSRVAGQF